MHQCRPVLRGSRCVGDLVGTYGVRFGGAQLSQPAPPRPLRHVQRATAELAYNAEETNFTLGLAELNVRLKRRALVILFTESSTPSRRLLIESSNACTSRHVVVLVTMRDNDLHWTIDAEPKSFEAVAEFVHRAGYPARSRRGCSSASSAWDCMPRRPDAGVTVALINRYLLIKQRGLI